MGERKLKFTQVHNFCHHLPLPQKTKTELKSSFTIVTIKLIRGCSDETEQRVNRSNNRTVENLKRNNQRQTKLHICTKQKSSYARNKISSSKLNIT